MIEILADEITRSPLHTAGMEESSLPAARLPDGQGRQGYALRFPRMTRFKEDREPEDATTVKELIEMYNLQYKK